MKILKKIGIAFSAFVGFLLLWAVSFLIWPQVLLNEHTLRWAAQHAEKQQIEIKWEHAKLDVESFSLFRKKIDFSFQNLCVVLQEPKFKGCTPLLEFSFVTDLLKRKVTELGEFQLKNLQWSLSPISGVLDLTTLGGERGELRPLEGGFS